MTFYQTNGYSYPLFAPIVWLCPTNPHLYFMFDEVPYNHGNSTLTHPSIFEDSIKPTHP